MKKITDMKVRGLASVLFTLALTFPAFAAAQTFTVTVPDHCTAVDSDGASHDYSGGYFGICALEAAKQAGDISSVVYSNAYPSFGLFVTAIDGTAADPSSQYWALYQNGGYASLGLSQLPVAAGDTLVLQLEDFSGTNLGHGLTLTIGSLASSQVAAAASAAGGGVTLHNPFDARRALDFIAGMQKENGSFDTLLFSDWAAIAFANGGAGDAQKKLAQYFREFPPVLDSITDNERHAMALEALGIDPYTGTGINYIAPIVSSFDGAQVGDRNLVNDDIFALFPLLHAGYTVHDPIIASTTAFIISQQGTDGSWNGSADMTAAAIQALALVRPLPDTNKALVKARTYLQEQQKDDGSWGNSFSTSWVLQAIRALDESQYTWVRSSYHTPRYFITSQQQMDGGLQAEPDDDATRLWATLEAIPAVEAKTWDMLLHSFPKWTPSAESVSVTHVPAPVTADVTSSSATSSPSKPIMHTWTSKRTQATTSTENAGSSVTAQTAAATEGGGPLSYFWNAIVASLAHLF